MRTHNRGIQKIPYAKVSLAVDSYVQHIAQRILTFSLDIAFASSSILTRDVAGSAFQYAKIMTLPFFGSGIVELPPGGLKRAKNSRKMQMVFFVHAGKVLVTVGPPAVEQSGRGLSNSNPETNEFAISKGGVWVVPRGMSSSFFPSLSPLHTLHLRHNLKGCEPEPNATSCRHSKSTGSAVLEFLRRAVSAVCQLIFQPRRRRLEAVCATSRRNNLSIAPEHRTSCVPSHQRPIPFRVVFFFKTRGIEGKEKKKPPRRVTSQMPPRVCVFGGTTADMPIALVLAGLLCDFGCCTTFAGQFLSFFVWRAACVPITSFAHRITKDGMDTDLFGCSQATTTQSRTRVGRRMHVSSLRRAVRWSLSLLRRSSPVHVMFLFIACPFCSPRRWFSVGLPPTLRRFLVIEPSMSDDCLEYCPASSIGSIAQDTLVGFFVVVDNT